MTDQISLQESSVKDRRLERMRERQGPGGETSRGAPEKLIVNYNYWNFGSIKSYFINNFFFGI